MSVIGCLMCVWNCRDDDTNSHCVPVIRSSADKLLVESRDTLQKTLLLRKQICKDNVDDEMAQKYEEFRRRMEGCSVRRKELLLKQNEVRFVVTSNIIPYNT